MLGVLPFVEDPDLSWTGGPAVPQLLPPCPLLYLGQTNQEYFIVIVIPTLLEVESHVCLF